MKNVNPRGLRSGSQSLPGTRTLVAILVCIAIAGALFGAWLQISPSDSLQGKVIFVADGDTLTLQAGWNQQVTIRLAEIDTPEKGQPYADLAKEALSGMVFEKEVDVVVQDIDRYGRTVGRVYVGELDVSAELVRSGAAWVYRNYLKDESLLGLERDARAAKIGIWALPESQQIPPWKWRENKREQRAAPAPGSSDPDCLIKGNINSKGTRIYHVPGWSSYDATRINTAKGERWFCSEEEAQTAGWRAPKR